ncbi:glycosyltransferase [Tepidamorphus sp. 3E244]|uniref:glycosyltransferase n=1 Tax=Tepidamorphus sp. 3E244 TaxID=3385498 RepID=UPI0038FC8478
MHVLITNLTLRGHTGTETATRDIALSLVERNAKVSIFAKRLGRIARKMRGLEIEVVDRLEDLSEPPDVIHGHHNIPAVAALAHFPGVPMVWTSRDTRNWFDRPPLFSRIRKYVVVDELRRNFLVDDHGIDGGRVDLVHNGIDLKRFPLSKTERPQSPRSVCVFSKTHNEVSLVRSVCRERGLSFSAFGRGPGKRTDDPKWRLAASDIVFATGRSAIEAMSCGAAVVVADGRGFAGVVTPDNYTAMRDQNFGRGAFSGPITRDAVDSAIASYDQQAARVVRDRVRVESDIELCVDRYEALYESALAAPPVGSADERDEFAAFLADWPARRLGNSLRWRREHALVEARARG